MKSKQIMTLFALLMLVYQGWRVMDYMGGSLQGVSPTVSLVISLAFLAFSELGLLMWLHVAQPNATTDLQEGMSTAMIWIDFAGSMALGLADLARHNTLYVIDLGVIDPLLFIAPWLMVVLNIGGYLVYTLNDSDAKLEAEERRLRHAEVSLEMAARQAALRELNASKEALAGKLAPAYWRDVQDRVLGRTAARFDKAAAQLRQGDLFPGLTSKSNGHKPQVQVFNDDTQELAEIHPKNQNGRGSK